MYRSTQQPLELPQWEGGGKEFQEILLETFRPFYQRLSSEAAVCGRLLKEHYASFRREHGCLTYADCIERAQQCLETDEAKAFYRKNAVSILLDEAQDTDRAQFRFLQTLVSVLGRMFGITWISIDVWCGRGVAKRWFFRKLFGVLLPLCPS